MALAPTWTNARGTWTRELIESLLNRLTPRQQLVNGVLAEHFSRAGAELYLVGGIVRVALMSADTLTDLDYATSATPAESREILEHASATSVYLVGERFGTVAAVFGEEPDRLNVEVTSYRREVYPDQTRFPEVAFDATLTDDLGRRDFTMNAIAVESRSGVIVDPWNGEADIAQALIRAVGNPDDRFREDPLRLLRAARFVSQLGFRLDWPTEHAMSRQAASLARISQERVLAELTRLLIGQFASHGLETLRQTGLLRVALPELEPLAAENGRTSPRPFGREKALWDHTVRVVAQAPARPSVRWAALFHDAGKPSARSVDQNGEVHFFGHERAGADIAARGLARLNADKVLRTAVVTLVALHGRPAAYDESWTDSAVRRLALEAGVVWDDLLDLAAADVTSGRERKRIEAAQRVYALRQHFYRLQKETELANLNSPLDGNDLMRYFDLSPGPWIKRVKEHLRELVIDGELKFDDRDRALTIAGALLAEEIASQVPAVDRHDNADARIIP
ncbi:MAG: HD domain-containing protein [Chloroflexia bacterium]|nr:HD domain-containing protein [Chloroflexia bacterium]